MKKIFTLIGMALVAMSVNAQEMVTKTYSVGNGDFNVTDKAQAIQVKEGDKGCVNVAILSSPYPDDEYEQDGEKKDANNFRIWDLSKPKNPWTLQDAEDQSLSILVPDFTKRLDGKGNPFLTENFEWVLSSDKGYMVLVDVNTTNEVFVAGGDKLPARGMFIKATPIVNGKLKLGVKMNNGGHPFYVIPVDESTKAYTPLDASKFTEVKGYFRTNAWNTGADKTPFTLVMPETLIIQDQEITYTEYAGTPDEKVTTAKPTKQSFIGTVEFNVEAKKTYWIFTPKSQVGFYGFSYTYDKAAFDAADPLPDPELPTGIEAVKTVKAQSNTNAAMYNLAGQKVDAGFKGMVIQNGVKFMNK